MTQSGMNINIKTISFLNMTQCGMNINIKTISFLKTGREDEFDIILNY